MRKRLVVIDDDWDIRFLLESIMSVEFPSWQVTSYESGELAQQHDWAADDVAIVDWQLPGISGPEVIRFLNNNFPEVDCVIFTANPEVTVRQKLENWDIVDHDTIPYFTKMKYDDLFKYLEKTYA